MSRKCQGCGATGDANYFTDPPREALEMVDAAGNRIPAHRIGVDHDGNRIYQHVEGWTIEIPAELELEVSRDADGNYVVRNGP